MFIGSLNKKLWLFSFFPGFFLRFISAGSIVASKMNEFQCIRYRISNQVSSENKFCQNNLTTISFSPVQARGMFSYSLPLLH